MATWYLSILTLLFTLCMCLPSSSSQATFTLSLTQHIAVPSRETETNQHPLLRTINYLVSSSLARAHHLKNPNHNSSSSSSSNPQIPLFTCAKSGGFYDVSLSFGSPPQKLSFLMDTGSSLVWFPCIHGYKCHKCGLTQTNIPVFIPDHSSSTKVLACNDKKCGWVYRPADPTQCNGTQICPYQQRYGSGSTTGALLSETLHFPEGDVTDFAVGCSVSSTGIPEGIVGFGRRLQSLPVQMGLKKFSYCLVSHQFDDKPISSELVLVRNSSNSGAGDGGISYTKFRKNPSTFPEYYYLNLWKITVGGKYLKIPYRFLVPGSDGNGGTIIDSGTTYTYMDSPIYDPLKKEFENQLSKYERAFEVESSTELTPCFNIGSKPPVFPKLVLHFKGGAKLSLPMADYFYQFEPGVVCMTIVSSGSNSSIGPSIIMGNHQQQNIYVEYDLENGRLGFKNKICNPKTK